MPGQSDDFGRTRLSQINSTGDSMSVTKSASARSQPAGKSLAKGSKAELSERCCRGRPSKYDPAYRDIVIAMGRRGKSRIQMAAALRVNRDTLSEWAKVHPEFKEAMDFALTCAQAWWEELGEANLHSRAFNKRLWILTMKRRFPRAQEID